MRLSYLRCCLIGYGTNAPIDCDPLPQILIQACEILVGRYRSTVSHRGLIRPCALWIQSW